MNSKIDKTLEGLKKKKMRKDTNLQFTKNKTGAINTEPTVTRKKIARGYHK